jgi:hypothetical protein
MSQHQEVVGVDYDGEADVYKHISPLWWLEHESSKYMLAIFVHKDIKDISFMPTRLPPGDTREEICKEKEQALLDEWATAKANRPVPHGDIDHQIKMACVTGMRSHVEKQNLESIVEQINVMRKNEQMYKMIYGEVKYQQMIVNLMNKMPGLGMVNEMETVDAGTGLVNTMFDGEANDVEILENSEKTQVGGRK